MNAKNVTRIVLGIAAVVLAYFLFESIMKPQRYETLKTRKEVEIINRLKDIRTAEIAYRGIHGTFVSTIDSLVLFLENGKLPVVKKVGEIPDSLSEREALKLGIISRDTVFTDAYSALFPPDSAAEKHLTSPEEIEKFRLERKRKHLETLKYIPFTNRTKEFVIEVGTVPQNNIQVPVIQVSAYLEHYMPEPEYKQLVINTIARENGLNRFPGRKFGSLLDPITEGNWE